MKTRRSPRPLLAAYSAIFSALLLVTAGSLHAQTPTVVINVQEDGQNTFTSSVSGNGSLAFLMAADPGPGGLALALTFRLGSPPALVAGDVFLFELGATTPSDIIRFNPSGTGSAGYPASLVFYSLLGGGLLADTGFPTSSYTNNLNITEGLTGLATYVPTAGQPGFVTGFAVTYNFTSSAAIGAVPESGSNALLLGLALAGIFGAQRLLTERKAAAVA
jgi:hypothetical protein